MSWDGYEISVCENAHEFTQDPYNELDKCPECNGKIIKTFVFETTNGDKEEEKHNQNLENEVRELIKNVLKTNPEARKVNIKELEALRDKFINSIPDTINFYNKRIKELKEMN